MLATVSTFIQAGQGVAPGDALGSMAHRPSANSFVEDMHLNFMK